MKIPGLTYGGVQTRGRRDLDAPLREAAAKVEVIEGVNQIVQNTVAVGQDVFKSYVDYKMRDADTTMRLGVEDFETNNSKKPFFSPSEIPEGIEYVSTEQKDGQEVARERIPSWEVYPQMLQQHIGTSIADNAANIPQNLTATRWKQEADVFGAKLVTQATANARTDQHTELLRSSGAAIEKYISKNMWQDASKMAASYPGTAAQRAEVVLNTKGAIEAGKQTNELGLYYSILSDEEDTPVQLKNINTSLNVLEADNYKGDVVDEDKRFRIIELLRRKRSDISSLASNKHKSNQKIILRELRQATKANLAGNKVDTAYSFDLQDRANAAGITNLKDPKHYDTWMDFQESDVFGRVVNKFLRNDPLHQVDKLERLKDRAKTGIQMIQYDRLLNASKEYKQELKTDAVSAAERVGLVNITPVDFTNLGESLTKRATSVNIVQDKTGHFTGYLTKDETAQFSDVISKAPSDTRRAIISEVATTLGPDAYKFYDQLGLKASVPTFVMSGKAAADGMPLASNLILNGADILEKYPTIIQNAKIDMDPMIEESLGSVYWQDSTSRAATTNAIHNIYASMAAESKDFSGMVDEDRLTQAIAMATNGIAVVNDVSVETPVGVETEVFESWVETTPSSYFKAHGSPTNFSPKQTSDGIRSGDIELVNTFNRGQYNLLYGKDGKLLFNDDGAPYIFSYDPQIVDEPAPGWFAKMTATKDLQGTLEHKGIANLDEDF